MFKNVVVIGKYKSFVEFVKKLGIFDWSTVTVVERASPHDVIGKVVVGAIPVDLAARASLVLVPKFNLPKELHDKELTLEEIKKYFVKFRVFSVKEVEL